MQKKRSRSKKKVMVKRSLGQPMTTNWAFLSQEDERIVTEELKKVCKKENQNGLCIGLNTVTRSIEKDLVSVVFVAVSNTPEIMISHFPVLCSLKNVKLCGLRINSVSFGQIIGSKSTAICLAIKKDQKKQEISRLLQLINSVSPQVISWFDPIRNKGGEILFNDLVVNEKIIEKNPKKTKSTKNNQTQIDKLQMDKKRKRKNNIKTKTNNK
ncbi:ribonuclease p protein subunit p38 [Anaeramoeba flamelloides]|uniref:Ribonuclease p protein subunit p38 n=1 Tax=Anaeramoeba flamelloides TaxID=1746091 RepID=A0AAV7YF33_9EUKA|nr:ribonuclease p protein subunit p38 [Anaeramoeba flamelloides]KAJ6242692.1 ribonuclease p protein subunit p38 [Anaeramoeba flamelloides]